MADATDPLMDLCDGMVTALGNSAFASQFAVQWKDDALIELTDEELKTTQVWVVDAAESILPAWQSGAAQHGVPIEEFETLVIVQYKFGKDDGRPAKCRQLSALVGQITRFLRATSVIGAVCVKTVRDPARNLKDYNHFDRYYTEIRTTWHRVLEDE